MNRGAWKTIEINWDDCDHISTEEKDSVRAQFPGQPDFVNSVAGYDFMPLVQDAIINGRALDENLANPPEPKPQGEVHAFCDFAWSGSGNENVLALRKGNVVSVEKVFHSDHLIASIKKPEPGICETFIAGFMALGLNSSQISGDEGGGGKLVMDQLDAMGWFLNRVNNGGPASDEHYQNIGAEMWFQAAKHIILKTFVLPANNMKFRGQALSRKTKSGTKGKLAIESKEEMVKLRGVASPDLADAVFGCMMPRGGYFGQSVSFAIPMAVGHPMGAMV